MELILLYKIIGLMLFAYFLGSVPSGLLLTRHFSSVNIIEQGSGNIGATNVRRVAGSLLGVMTLVGDLLKGMIPVLIACILFWDDGIGSQMVICLVALSSFLGHIFPIYLKFRNGGKGVATAFGCFLVISPLACLVLLFIFVVVIFISKRVSIGSLVAAWLLPVGVWIETNFLVFSVCAIIYMIIIFLRHQDNIRRIFRGNEPVI
jgi:acyl phosphate:glycerol-3-phosphate acyltransferase